MFCTPLHTVLLLLLLLHFSLFYISPYEHSRSFALRKEQEMLLFLRQCYIKGVPFLCLSLNEISQLCRNARIYNLLMGKGRVGVSLLQS